MFRYTNYNLAHDSLVQYQYASYSYFFYHLIFFPGGGALIAIIMKNNESNLIRIGLSID